MNIELTDPIYHNKENGRALDGFVLKFINDKRDLPFVYLTLLITATVVPFAAVLFFVSGLHWFFYAAYFALYIFFLGPYILMLHNTCHRKLFKKQYSAFTKYIHWFLGLFFGQTPETYFHHHIAMHHAENNLEEDLSSTMRYRRDSIRSFLQYLIHFYFLGVLHLSFYFSKKNRHKFAWRVLTGESIYILLMIGLCFYNLPATLVVFVLP